MEQEINIVNASDFFNAIELGDVESQMFLDTVGFKYELNGLILTGGSVFIWCLKKFIVKCEDIYEKGVMIKALEEFTSGMSGNTKYVNLQA
jgi:hypothetical protein